MLTVYAVPGAWGLPSASPFCLKLLYFLDLMAEPYQVRTGAREMRRAPNGKLPYIDLDGELIADTHVIIPHLQRRLGRGLFDDLSPAQRGAGHAALRVAEDSLYWTVVYSRWAQEDGWKHLRPQLEKLMPPVVGLVLMAAVRRGVLRQLHQVGVSRLPPKLVLERGERDLDALAGLIGERPFVTGDEVTVYDVAVCAQLANILVPSYDSPLRELAVARPALGQWVERLDDRRRAARATLRASSS